jgi:phosphoribosylformylglycinamidine cyclo-ligase
MSHKYAASGVSIDQGYEAVSLMKKHIMKTKNRGVMESIGGFGGLFDLSSYQIKEPILVSGTDGVGTKLMIAQQMNKHDTIGIDLVAMCVNDIITVGARPMFFLDYIATHRIDPKHIESLVKGMTDGCIMAECALIGGETAEMNDLYEEGDYDLAGYSTGVVEKSKLIQKEHVKEGQILIGLASSGIHSNGYSLVRKIFFKDHIFSIDHVFEELGKPLGEVLLEPTAIYVKAILNLLEQVSVKGIAHITGGGFIENIPRMLPDGLGVLIEEKTLPKLPIFTLMERLGEIDHQEMYNIFNMGIGMVVIVDSKDVECALTTLAVHHARVIGHVINEASVIIKP